MGSCSSSRVRMSASSPSGARRWKYSAASTVPTKSLSQIGSSQEPIPAGSAPRRRASQPSRTSVTAAAASTPKGSAGCAGSRSSATQKRPPSGSRAALSAFGNVRRRSGRAGDIARAPAYHQRREGMARPARIEDDDTDGEEAAAAGDEILRCTVVGGAARIVAVTATGVAREAIRRHGATGAAAVALARGVTSGLLLATLTKDEERVTMQLLGDGPLGGVTVDATAGGTARGYVKNPTVPLDAAPEEGAIR